MKLRSVPLAVLITSGKASAENFVRAKTDIVELVRLASEAGFSHVQIREKNLPAKLLYELTAESVAAARSGETKILVNGRFDVAVAAKAHGVHLPSNSIPIDAVRRACPPDLIISAAAHSLDDVAAAKDSGANMALLSPIFATPGKGTPLGTGVLAEAVLRFEPFPIVALGGIDETNYHEVLETGAAGFAAIRFLNDADGIKEVGRYLNNE